MQQYRIIIKNERYHQVKFFQVIFLAVMSIVFIVAAYYQNDMFNLCWPVLLCFTIFIELHQEDFNRWKLFRFTLFLESGFVWTIAGAAFLLNWWITLLVIIIACMQLLVKKQHEIIVSVASVKIKAQPEKNIDWQSLQNLVVKDDLLTLDYKNNKIFQAEIIAALSNIGSEAEFNDFCRLQLDTNK